MLNRLTVSALLKTVILATAFCVVIGFSLNAWESWSRLQLTNRIAVIADASANLFKAMHNLRTDRSTTNRLLNSDAADRQRHRQISAQPSRHRNAGDEQRARAAAVDRIRAADDAGARARSAVQDADGRAEGILGAKSPSRRPRAARRWPRNIWKRPQALLDDARQTVRRARRRRQPPGSPRSTSCWRSSRSPGCCATPPARRRS